MVNGNAGSLPLGCRVSHSTSLPAYRLLEAWDCLDSPRDPCQRVLAVGMSSKLTTQNSLLNAKIEDCTKCYVRWGTGVAWLWRKEREREIIMGGEFESRGVRHVVCTYKLLLAPMLTSPMYTHERDLTWCLSVCLSPSVSVSNLEYLGKGSGWLTVSQVPFPGLTSGGHGWGLLGLAQPGLCIWPIHDGWRDDSARN